MFTLKWCGRSKCVSGNWDSGHALSTTAKKGNLNDMIEFPETILVETDNGSIHSTSKISKFDTKNGENKTFNFKQVVLCS